MSETYAVNRWLCDSCSRSLLARADEEAPSKCAWCGTEGINVIASFAIDSDEDIALSPGRRLPNGRYQCAVESCQKTIWRHQLCATHVRMFEAAGRAFPEPKTYGRCHEMRIDGDVAYFDLPDASGKPAETITIDAADANKVAQHLWSRDGNGYARNRKLGSLHRWLLGLERGDKRWVDHINRDRSDNRRSNLRIGTSRVMNAQNLSKAKTFKGRPTTSRYLGVHQTKDGAWVARGHRHGKPIYLGRFENEEAAARVAAEWRKKNYPWYVGDKEGMVSNV